MWLQQKLNPTPTDKTQAMIFTWMPWIFMFMLGSFASGLVIYWVANNTITFTQQYTIMRTQGVKPNVLGNILGAAQASSGRRTECRRASAHLWRHPIKGHGVEAVDAVTLAAGATMPWDRVWAIAHEAAQGGAGRRRLGALRQLQPRREVVRADGDPRRGRRGRRAGDADAIRAASRSPSIPTIPADAARLVAWVTPLVRPGPGAARPSWSRAGRRHDRQRLPLDRRS